MQAPTRHLLKRSRMSSHIEPAELTIRFRPNFCINRLLSQMVSDIYIKCHFTGLESAAGHVSFPRISVTRFYSSLISTYLRNCVWLGRFSILIRRGRLMMTPERIQREISAENPLLCTCFPPDDDSQILNRQDFQWVSIVNTSAS